MSRFLEEVWIVAPFGGASAPSAAVRVDPMNACLRVGGWFPDETLAHGTLVEIVGYIDRNAGTYAASASRSWLVERVAEALRKRRLEAYVLRTSTVGSGGSRKVVASAPADEAPIKPKSDAPPVEPGPVATWIGLKLVDQTGAPVGGRRYRVKASDGTVKAGALGATGMKTVQGIPPGECQVFCPYFEPVDSHTYVVKDGEHLADIAERFGYENDQTIWMDGKNAALRELRPNAYVLAEGDELYLPAREPKAQSKPTGAEHIFTLETTPLKLKLVLETFNSKPIASQAMTLKPAPLDAPPTTGVDGDIDLTIARSSRFFQFALDGHEGELHVGRLDPITEDAGVNARLVNLGYLHGTPEEADGDELALAIEELQADALLPVTGTIDDATRDKLVTMHGS